jgi:ribosome-associated protein
MADDDGLRVSRGVVIPAHELQFSFTPSGGPGGQHANKTSTRAELTWNVDESGALSGRQKERLKARLRSRIDARGVLHLVSDEYRSQTRNRADVQKRLASLVAQALVPPKSRVATRPTKAANERRLESKKHRSETKRRRRLPDL